ncbi:hypothetical protein MANES_07G107900v8 [Manihot esculenta]|uniref:Uncharacterized protein n=1 Tax=Manihot esculenta TaxID=3983 RepID=A0ACB7HH12_MANES|nr:hypothetical protein MANES_07G107900v8 [Manihot esculenta]
MGLCFSAGIQSESALHCCRNYMDKSSSKASSAIVPLPAQITRDEILESPNLKIFCFRELKEATGDFSQDNELRTGEFGCFFKGWVDEHTLKAVRPETGMAIAVKVVCEKSCQGQQEWLAKIKYLGQLRHPNLVKLIGFCLEDDHWLLVYEFMLNGNLQNHLFRFGNHSQPLSWNLYMKIALGAAKGLAYLHNEADVTCRDFKASNILLDSNYNAKLCDFGLAKNGPTNGKNFAGFLGTAGYIAPEYISTGHVTAKSNVYNFGVVLLEILSGRQSISIIKPSEGQDFVEWARNLASAGKFSHFMNNLDVLGQNSSDSFLKVAKLAFQCVSKEPNSRPTMKDVVEVLQELQDFSENVGKQENFKHYLLSYKKWSEKLQKILFNKFCSGKAAMFSESHLQCMF